MSHVAQWFHLLCVYVFFFFYICHVYPLVSFPVCMCLCVYESKLFCEMMPYKVSDQKLQYNSLRGAKRESMSRSPLAEISIYPSHFFFCDSFILCPHYFNLHLFLPPVSFFAYSLGIDSKDHLLFPISCLCRALLSAPIKEHGSHWQHTHAHKRGGKNTFGTFIRMPFLYPCLFFLPPSQHWHRYT